MGPKAAGLSRSMGGAVWSPWPWPVSAQAGPYLSLILIPDSHSGIRPTLPRLTDQPHKAGFPILWQSLKDRVRTGVGACQQPPLGSWGELYLDSRVCV